MVQDKNPSQDTVQKGGHTAVLENVSYDKDVVEIEPADAIDSAHCGGSFVKDVCVDEGAQLRRTRTASEENPLDRRSSPNFSRQVICADSDGNCSRIDAGSVAAGECSSEKKVSLQELLLLESAEPGDAYGRKNQEPHGHTDQERSLGSMDDAARKSSTCTLAQDGSAVEQAAGHGDSSKPAAARVGDEDTYDHEPDLSGRGGPVSVSGRHPACSGSVSLRSDSSARSFAFPVLQGEWTGSPVRMAKAEPRHSGRRRRRRRAWRKGIVCCKF